MKVHLFLAGNYAIFFILIFIHRSKKKCMSYTSDYKQNHPLIIHSSYKSIIIMWIKKFFIKEELKSETSQIEPNDEESLTDSHIFIDVTPDLRYSTIKIIKSSKNLNIPQHLIHFTESALFHEQGIIQGKTCHSNQWLALNIVVTDRQIVMSPNLFAFGIKNPVNNILTVPYGIIEKIENVTIKKQPNKLLVTLKDSRSFLLQSVLGDHLKNLEELVKIFGFPKGVNKLYAFKYGKIINEKKHNGWKIYNFFKEIKRQTVQKYANASPNPTPHPYRIVNNSNGELCETYSQFLIIPNKISDSQLMKCSKFRTKERFPAMTYFYEYSPQNFVTLFRCSQNKSGIMSNRSPQDQKMIASIGEAAQMISNRKKDTGVKHNCKIYDARGYYAALGNKLAGKGFEYEEYYKCEIQFLNIPNIHAVRASYNRIKNYNPATEEFNEVLAASGWIDYLFLILAGSKSVAQSLLSGVNVLVHCSDGWDRTAQLCSLGQLLIDPYFRTLQGIIVLIQKDWRHFGHKFRERTGQFQSKDYSPQDISPVFIQFLDCIYQIMDQFPASFEYNHLFLNFLADATQSYTYGNFMTNSIQQGKQIQVSQATISVWSDVYEKREQFISPFYLQGANLGFLDISAHPKDMTIWSEHLIGEQVSNQTGEFIIAKEQEVNLKLQQQYAHNAKILQELKAQRQSQ